MGLKRCYGIHAVSEVLKNPRAIEKIYFQHTRLNQRQKMLLQKAKTHKVPVQVGEGSVFQTLRSEIVHQGVMATLKKQTAPSLSMDGLLTSLSEKSLILILDGVQDPHNLGACLRSADAVGVSAVIIPEKNAAQMSETVAKVACGAAETVPLMVVKNISRTLKTLKESGVWVYGLAGEAEASLIGASFHGPTALVLGSEGKGLRALTRSHCDALYAIPMQGTVESLNVSVACALALFEARRGDV